MFSLTLVGYLESPFKDVYLKVDELKSTLGIKERYQVSVASKYKW